MDYLARAGSIHESIDAGRRSKPVAKIQPVDFDDANPMDGKSRKTSASKKSKSRKERRSDQQPRSPAGPSADQEQSSIPLADLRRIRYGSDPVPDDEPLDLESGTTGKMKPRRVSGFFSAEQMVQSSDQNHRSPEISEKKSCFDKLNHRINSAIKEMMRFRALKIAQLLLMTYILILTFADIGPPGGLRDTETGLIVDPTSPERTARGVILLKGTERAIVGATTFQVVCIGIARASAWLMYPGKSTTSTIRVRRKHGQLTSSRPAPP